MVRVLEQGVKVRIEEVAIGEDCGQDCGEDYYSGEDYGQDQVASAKKGCGLVEYPGAGRWMR